ncbi:MAG: hydantoinase/oxoprolinase family protein [Dehalococcoidales bacterium]|nr:hydantoinase/oxoprolinase family protein [Dehalococcoidales bacterium]
MPQYRLGVDIGGTFTDVVLMNLGTGEFRTAKVATTPQDLATGFLHAMERVVVEAAVTPEEVAQIIHATTVATNAIIENKVARSAFITTRGFRDILEIQRQIRPTLYDLFFDKPPSLIPRYLCYEVTERVTAEGEVLQPLDEDEVRQVVRQIKQEAVEAIAVCFLHSYITPAHEKRTGEIVKAEFPEAYLTLSSEINPEFREYFRASTTVINAVLMPLVARYVDKLQKEISARGFKSGLYVMQSGGGLMTGEVARDKPAAMVESGPAAGVIAASSLGTLLGYPNVISFDMGGTTAKAGLVERGRPKLAVNYEVGSAAISPDAHGKKGSGYPLQTPVIDLVEIGAGGGSIAWIDTGGALRVGPQSAGADPGPACYMAGGTLPTITDANVVLGRIDPDYFLGGEIKLDRKAAEKAIEEHCARTLDKDVATTAAGIVEIANAHMIRALRIVSVERGYDPREYVLIAFGGAGPMHVNGIVKELEIPTVIVPLNPGITSALGLLMTDLRHDYVVTYICRVDRLDLDKVNRVYRDFTAQGRSLLTQESVKETDMLFSKFMDIRYVGQSYERTIPVPSKEIAIKDMGEIAALFHKEHERAYGHCAPNEPVEVANLKLSATGIIPKPKLKDLKRGESTPEAALLTTRQVYFSETEGFVECSVYDRYKLRQGNAIKSPAIVEDKDATTVIHPGYQVEVGRYGNMILTPGSGETTKPR